MTLLRVRICALVVLTLTFSVGPIFTRARDPEKFNGGWSVINETRGVEVVENSIKSKSPTLALKRLRLTETIKKGESKRESEEFFPSLRKNTRKKIESGSGESSSASAQENSVENVIPDVTVKICQDKFNDEDILKELKLEGFRKEKIIYHEMPDVLMETDLGLLEILRKADLMRLHQLTGLKIPCQFHTSQKSKTSVEYSLILRKSQTLNKNETLRYDCRETVKNETRLPRRITVVIQNPPGFLRQQLRLKCEPTTLRFSNFKGLSKTKTKCIFVPSCPDSKPTFDDDFIKITDHPKIANSSDIDNYNQSRPRLRVTSWVHQKYLQIANVSWDFQSNGSRQYFVLTWEIVGGGLKGNLVTDENTATISLVPESVYSVQVGILAGSEDLANATALDLAELLFSGAVLKVNETIGAIIVNTSRKGSVLENNNQNSSILSDARIPTSSQKLNWAKHFPNRVTVIRTNMRKSMPRIYADNMLRKYRTFDQPTSDKEFDFKKFKNETLGITTPKIIVIDRLIQHASTFSDDSDEFPVIAIVITILGTLSIGVLILYVVFLLFWPKLIRFCPRQSSTATVNRNNGCGCTMKVPFVISDSHGGCGNA